MDADASRLVRPFDIGADESGNYLCPYELCSVSFLTTHDRLRHMIGSHEAATEWRLQEIESHLGGPWREKASCLGLDGFLTEPTSRDKATARAIGHREPTAGERRAFQVCLSCPVRRDCAKASLQPPPRHPELPPLRDPLDHEPLGIWCGVRADDRRKLVNELGTGPDALEALLRLGAKMAKEYH